MRLLEYVMLVCAAILIWTALAVMWPGVALIFAGLVTGCALYYAAKVALRQLKRLWSNLPQ